MTNEHTSLEKYTSHTLFSKGLQKGWERVMNERWVGEGTDCNILTPSSSVYSSTSSFSLAAQPGCLRAQALCLELVLTASNCNSKSNCNWLQLIQTVRGTCLYNCLTCTCFPWASQLLRIQPVHRTRWYPDIFDRMHLFLDWRLGRGSIYYTILFLRIQFSISQQS